MSYRIITKSSLFYISCSKGIVSYHLFSLQSHFYSSFLIPMMSYCIVILMMLYCIVIPCLHSKSLFQWCRTIVSFFRIFIPNPCFNSFRNPYFSRRYRLESFPPLLRSVCQLLGVEIDQLPLIYDSLLIQGLIPSTNSFPLKRINWEQGFLSFHLRNNQNKINKLLIILSIKT